MSNSKLVQEWMRAARDLGLRVIAPFTVELSSGARIEVEFLLKDFGALNGMLIVTDFSRIAPYSKEILEAGYGFSTLSEPHEIEPYNRDDFIEVLRD